MNSTKKIGSVIVAASLPLLMMAISAPVANAAGVSSSVVTVDKCVWVMGGGSNIELETPAKYDGDALELTHVTDVEDLYLGITGSLNPYSVANTETTDCSFYNNEVGAQILATIASSNFVAKYGANATEVPALGFDIENSPINFSVNLRINELNQDQMEWALGDFGENAYNYYYCREGFTAPEGLVSLTGTDGGDVSQVALFGMPQASVLSDYFGTGDDYPIQIEDANQICRPMVTTTVTIPAVSGVPEGAGSQFTFTGPTITYSKVESGS